MNNDIYKCDYLTELANGNFIYSTFNKTICYGEEARLACGLDEDFECLHKLMEDNGERIFLFTRKGNNYEY